MGLSFQTRLLQGVSGVSFWRDSFLKGFGGLLICLSFENLGNSGLEWKSFRETSEWA